MLASKRIAYKVYEVTIDNRIFTIDGQNHEFDSKEWQVFEELPSGNEWVETYHTKKDALLDLPNII